MPRAITILGAASNIGIRPYDDGRLRGLDRAPAVLRDQGLVSRLQARDAGDVEPPPYRDFARPPGGARNEAEVAEYSRALADRVAELTGADTFLQVLGGDCSIVLGCLLGVGRRHERVGLMYIDAHADFATPSQSDTGSVASMCLAMAVGRGDTPLARLNGSTPLVRPEDLVVIGRRDDADPWYGQEEIRRGPMLDFPQAAVREQGVAAIAGRALQRMSENAVDAFWIHVDADVIDPSIVPAVDSPEPGGLSLDETAELLTILGQDARSAGCELTIYDPNLDADGSSVRALADLLERAFASHSAGRPA